VFNRIETIANQVDESIIKQAMALAHTSVTDIIDAQKKYFDGYSAVASIVERKQARVVHSVSDELRKAVDELGLADATLLYQQAFDTKAERGRAEGQLRSRINKDLAAHEVFSVEPQIVRDMAVEAMISKAFRAALLEGRRVDGRPMDGLRSIGCHPDVLPSVHGSAFFTRGETHVLCTTTLGESSVNDSQRYQNSLTQVSTSASAETLQNNFVLHYDFPPYCTGTVGNATGTNRRIVGHGNLAEKALRPVMPPADRYPYTVRVYSECTSSNGSSSMASVCGGSMALMDAGVPIRAAVAGLSIGLVTSDSITDERTTLSTPSYALVTDILGTEDHYGDMDFKIAGTSTGVTAIQLDVKLANGIPAYILEEALDRAKAARIPILDAMNRAIRAPRPFVKEHALKAEMIKYDPERKKFLVGPGGEMVRFIEKHYNVTLDSRAEGIVYIYGQDQVGVEEARQLVQDLVGEVKVGDVFAAEVLDIKV
jgi:polyribonucleotide nucleotidyltransferase